MRRCRRPAGPVVARGRPGRDPLQHAIGQPLDTREAGANTRFRFHLRLGGSEHIKDLTTQLPRGLIPNDACATCPLATFLADACPPATRTGSTTVSVAALGLLPMDVPGRIYNLSVPGEALPGSGIVLDAPRGKVFQRGRTEISQGRPQVVINDFPQTVTLLGSRFRSGSTRSTSSWWRPSSGTRSPATPRPPGSWSPATRTQGPPARRRTPSPQAAAGRRFPSATASGQRRRGPGGATFSTAPRGGTWSWAGEATTFSASALATTCYAAAAAGTGCSAGRAGTGSSAVPASTSSDRSVRVGGRASL
jgi:hypothetical protein